MSTNSINSVSAAYRDKLLNMTIGKYHGYTEPLFDPIGKYPTIDYDRGYLRQSNTPNGLLSYTNDKKLGTDYALYRDVENSEITYDKIINSYTFENTYLNEIEKKGVIGQITDFVNGISNGGLGISSAGSIEFENGPTSQGIVSKTASVLAGEDSKMGEFGLKALGISIANSVLQKQKNETKLGEWLGKSIDKYEEIDTLDLNEFGMSSGTSKLVSGFFPIYLYSEIKKDGGNLFSHTEDSNHTWSNIGEIIDISTQSYSPDDLKITNKQSLLYKTSEMFKSGKISTMIDKPQMNDEDGKIISKGSGLKTKDNKGFARVWSASHQYRTYNDLIRPLVNSSGTTLTNILEKDLKRVRPGDKVLKSYGVLEDTGLVKIAPYNSETFEKTDIKKYMFSIENLAWKGSTDELIEGSSQYGSYGGRLMWFPPYDINFSDNTSVNWNSDNFIGRGEPVYTYVNTERSGTLNFQMIVDHPSIINYYKESDPTGTKITDDDYKRFFGGEDVIDLEKVEKVVEKGKVIKPTITQENNKVYKFKIYFPNNYSGIDDGNSALDYLYSGMFCEITTGGTGYEMVEGNYNSLSYGLTEPCFYDKFYYRVDKSTTGQTFTISDNYKDTTSSGLNSTKENNYDFTFKEIYETLKSNTDSEISRILKSCKKIFVSGSASSQGTAEINEGLSKNREITVINWLKNYLRGTEILPNHIISTKNGVTGSTNDIKYKKERCVIVSMTVKPETEIITPETDQKFIVKYKSDSNITTITSGNTTTYRRTKVDMYGVNYHSNNDEAQFFQKLEKGDDFIQKALKDKIKYFHPAFHSTTPEGFNSRLTFLHQCTRQGPTNKSDNMATNLAFGRPPICILRIGDFYNTKVIFTDLNISFDPIVWDLNPEGIGVQPMLAKISMNFKFIGGSDLTGPIARLQNAITFNFFANTGVYDGRNDRLITDDQGKTKATIDKNGNLQTKYDLLYQPGIYDTDKKK